MKLKTRNATCGVAVWGLAFVFFFLPILSLAQTTGFDPGNLIADERFNDVGTLGGAEGIQKFLESKGSVLANVSTDFLVKLREPSDSALKAGLPDPRPNLGRLRSASELIYDAATSAGLNAQVILVTLQKEQSLITGQFSSDLALARALDRALGFGCPDEGGCSDIFLGFYHQLFGNFDAAANRYIGMPFSLVRSFNFEVGGVRVGRGPMVDALGNAYGNGTRTRVSRKGETIVLENTQGEPHNAPATQTVTMSNFATTALYRYTPHVYNGNYNFWKFFSAWFKYPDGTLVSRSGDPKIYIINNGFKRPISAFVISQRGLSIASVITVSLSELSEFELGDVMVPNDGSLLKNPAGIYYLIEQGEKKQVSTFVAKQRKLDLATAILLPDEEIQSYKGEGRALPEEGTLVKSKDNPGIFIIANNEKRLLSAFVFKQRGLKFGDVLEAEAGELDFYPTGDLMTPLNGTLIKASGADAVYHVGNGNLQPLNLFVFDLRNFRFRDVVVVPGSELSAWPMGKLMPPPTGYLIKGRDNAAVYYTESGVKRPVSYGVFVSRRFDFADVVVGSDSDIEAIELGPPLELADRALAKLQGSGTVYYLVDGVWRPLTYTAFQNRRLLFKDVVTISEEEFAKFPVGATVEN